MVRTLLIRLVVASILALLVSVCGCAQMPAGMDIGVSYGDGVHSFYYGMSTAPLPGAVVPAATSPAAPAAPTAPAAAVGH